MKVIYVAGPLVAADHWEIRHNINEAAALGLEVARLGHCPVIPHTNTGAVFLGTLTPEFWYEATLELLRRCDAIILTPYWPKAKGAIAERDEACRRKMPIFYNLDELRRWNG